MYSVLSSLPTSTKMPLNSWPMARFRCSMYDIGVCAGNTLTEAEFAPSLSSGAYGMLSSVVFQLMLSE